MGLIQVSFKSFQFFQVHYFGDDFQDGEEVEMHRDTIGALTVKAWPLSEIQKLYNQFTQATKGVLVHLCSGKYK